MSLSIDLNFIETTIRFPTIMNHLILLHFIFHYCSYQKKEKKKTSTLVENFSTKPRKGAYTSSMRGTTWFCSTSLICFCINLSATFSSSWIGLTVATTSKKMGKNQRVERLGLPPCFINSEVKKTLDTRSKIDETRINLFSFSK